MKVIKYLPILPFLFISTTTFSGSLYNTLQSKVDTCIDDKLYNSLQGIAYDYAEGTFVITKTQEQGDYLIVKGLGKMNMLFSQVNYPISGKFKLVLDEVVLVDCYLHSIDQIEDFR